MNKYTVEQVEAQRDAMRKWHSEMPPIWYGNKNIRDSADMLDAYAATLKAAQGGVTEAMVELAREVVHHETDCPAVGGNGDKDCRCDAVPFLRDLEAALSAQQGQGQGQVLWWARKDGTDTITASRKQEMLALGYPASHSASWYSVPLYTAPPAQPAERVPSFAELQTWALCNGWSGATYQQALDAWTRSRPPVPTLDQFKRMGWGQAEKDAADAAAYPAPSPARGDGGEG